MSNLCFSSFGSSYTLPNTTIKLVLFLNLGFKYLVIGMNVIVSLNYLKIFSQSVLEFSLKSKQLKLSDL